MGNSRTTVVKQWRRQQATPEDAHNSPRCPLGHNPLIADAPDSAWPEGYPNADDGKHQSVNLSIFKCTACFSPAGGGGGSWHEAMWFVFLSLAAPIGLSPVFILTLCGSERRLVVSTEPLDDVSCFTTPGSADPETGCCACR